MMKQTFFALAVLVCFCPDLSAQNGGALPLPGHHIIPLVSDTYGAQHQGDPPEKALWGINQGYDFGIDMDTLMMYNASIRYTGKLNIDHRETSINMLRQVCQVFLPDGTPVVYTVTYFVDEAPASPGGPQRGYFAVRVEIRSASTSYIDRKFALLVDEINHEFTAPINPVPARNGPYYLWGAAPRVWQQWPMELYYQEALRDGGQITYYHFSQLGQLQGERSQRFSVQALYNWVISNR
jgi:hypothetical protein